MREEITALRASVSRLAYYAEQLEAKLNELDEELSRLRRYTQEGLRDLEYEVLVLKRDITIDRDRR